VKTKNEEQGDTEASSGCVLMEDVFRPGVPHLPLYLAPGHLRTPLHCSGASCPTPQLCHTNRMCFGQGDVDKCGTRKSLKFSQEHLFAFTILSSP
jgi:hypothetical protein